MKRNNKIEPEKNIFCIAGAEEPETPYQWDGMPEYISNNEEAYCVLVITVESEEDFHDLLKKTDQESYTHNTKSVWYPQLEKDPLSLYRYILEDE